MKALKALKALKLYVARCKERDCSLTLFLGKPRNTSEGCWEDGPAISLMTLNLNRFPSLKPGKCREVGLFDVKDLRACVRGEALWKRVSALRDGRSVCPRGK